MEACRRRAMPETQEVEDALEATVEGRADNADEAMICHSDFSYREES